MTERFAARTEGVRRPLAAGLSRRLARRIQLSRAAYIRHAVERMNKETEATMRARRIAKVSRRVRRESMNVNREFSGA